MMRAGFAAFALLVAAAFAPAPAHAQRADCERLTDAHAYNRCLASSGPASRAGSSASPAASAASRRARVQTQSAGKRRAERSRAAARSGATVQRLPNGRLRLTIPTRRR